MKLFFKLAPFMFFAAIAVKGQSKFNYNEQWKVVDKLMDGVLPQSALPEIEKIQQAALNDKEYGHLITAVIVRNSCLQMTNEKPDVAIINSLKKDAETFPFPAKAVIYSLTGEAYLNFYNKNRWKIYERTALASEAETDDIEIWDATRLIREIAYNYQLSLEEKSLLQKTSIGAFKEALYSGADSRYLRPTLYDFLAHRAIDAYLKNDLKITDFSSSHVIDDPKYFDEAQTFVKMNIVSTDTLSSTYMILKLFQELTSFRLKQNDVNALSDVNMKRFDYLKNNGTFDDADDLYEAAMKKLVESCAGQKIWGKAAYTLAAYYLRQSGEWSGKNVRQRQRYSIDAVNLFREVEKKALSKDDKKLAADMLKGLTQPEASFSIEKNLIPNQPILALVSYKNMTSAFLNIYRYMPDELEDFLQRRSPLDVKEDFAIFLSKQEKAASYTLELPTHNDYQQHHVETKIDSLPLGNFLFVLSDKANPEKDDLTVLTYNPVQLTNIKMLQRNNGDGKIEAYVLDAMFGKPLHDAEITIQKREYNQQQSKYESVHLKDTFRTNSDGIAILPIINNNGGSGFRIVDIGNFRVKCGDDEMTGDLLNVYNRVEQAETAVRTVFFTDRAIYRPGQTIYFKGLMYETKNNENPTIKAKINTEVQLLDVNGREVAKQDFTTNDYGSFNGSFTLPQGALNGTMRIKNNNGAAFFRVEEYKRPTFELTINPVEGEYVLGDTITITGKALAFAGYPVDDAKLSFNVVRQQQFRYTRFMIYPSRKNDRQIATGIHYTDTNGDFSISFPAKADDIKMSDNSIYRYNIKIDVTDNNGETQSDSQTVNLSRIPLIINWNPQPLPLSKLEGRGDFEFPLSVENLNGIEIAAEVDVELWALKNPDRLLRKRLWRAPDTMMMQRDEFTQLFPNDPFIDDDKPQTYEKTECIATFKISAPQNNKIDLNILRNAPPACYFIKLKATGNSQFSILNSQFSIQDSAYIQLRQANSPIMNMDEWLTVVKNSGEPGDTAVFRIAGGNDSSLMLFDMLFKNQIIERKWLNVGRVPQELRIPILENYRGGFAVNFAMAHDNREYAALHEINVPYSNKNLDIAFTSFRGQLLPGEKEKWTLTVKNKNGERETAEMAATLYDASLDKLTQHYWQPYFFQNRSHWQYGWNKFVPVSDARNLSPRYYGRAAYFMEYENLVNNNYNIYVRRKTITTMSYSIDTVEEDSMPISEVTVVAFGTQKKESMVGSIASDSAAPSEVATSENGISRKSTMAEIAAAAAAAHAAIPLRSNFLETAFFYPELRTNEKGEITLEFTIPEALTRWNMLGFAHNKDLKTGNVANSLITQKQLAISANMPRFFRTGDTLILSAKVNNLCENELNGNALLRLFDAFTMQPIDAQMLNSTAAQPFVVNAGQSVAVQWKLAVPATAQAVTYRLTAQAGNHTDGEERSVPVLSARTLVTETMPFMLRANERKDLVFDSFANNNSPSLTNRRLTLEYTSNPAWYAVQALPYLMDYPYECAEQIFSRFYANSLATKLANSSQKIKQIFNQWRSLPDSKALLSNLEKNQELKQALLEETPWVMQAANETERKKRIALLFDLNRMANEQNAALDKLKAMQGGNGGFPWFAGMPEDRFITQHIVAGLEHLRKLNALPRNDDIVNIIERAMAYCDARISEDYKIEKQRADERSRRTGSGKTTEINSAQIHYLYTCSFSKHYSADRQSFDHYLLQAERAWTSVSVYEQAMIALIMHRFGKSDVSQNILRSLKERAITNDEMGMYWTDNRRGYFWYQAPIETQAMLIEAFNEAGSDARAVNEMKIWLLRNKQTNEWNNTKATALAIYAILSTGDMLTGGDSKQLDIRIAGKPLKNIVKEPLRPEAGTGYINTSWNGDEIDKNLANMRIVNPNDNIAYGAIYWQYFENMDKITAAQTNLQINKQLFIKRINDKGKILEPLTPDNIPRVGDIVTVRLELRADRDFEYVHLKDMRAAGFEPTNVLSGYRFKNGLGYYESIKDASVNFFISYVRAGTYVFEYDLRVANAGDFACGIATFQCMYAPEFNAHSDGVRVRIN